MEHNQNERGAGRWSTEDVHACHSLSEPNSLGSLRSHQPALDPGFEDGRLVRGGGTFPLPSSTLARVPTRMSAHKTVQRRGFRNSRADEPFEIMRDDSPRSPPEEVGKRARDAYHEDQQWRERSARSESPKRNNERTALRGRNDRPREVTKVRAREELEPCDLETTEEKHQVLIEKYSGNNEQSKVDAKLWLRDFKHRYGFLPMRVSLKTTTNTSGDLRERRGVKSVTCMACMESMKTVQDASIHIVSKHMHLKGFRCSYCPSTYARQDDLKRHVKSSDKCSSLKARSKVTERQQKEEWLPMVAVAPSFGHHGACAPAMSARSLAPSPFFSSRTDATSNHIPATASLPSVFEWVGPFSKQSVDYSPSLPSTTDIVSYSGGWPDDKVATHSANSYWPAYTTVSEYHPQNPSWQS